MERISAFASANYLSQLIGKTQARINEGQTQLASEKVSQDYAGIAADTRRLLSVENARTMATRFQQNNTLMKVDLGAADLAVQSIDTTAREFRAALIEQGNSQPLDAAQVATLQASAFRALGEMQAALNTKVDGRYLFAGGSTTTRPVDLGLTSLEDFQTRYDGRANSYPESRDASLATFSLAPGGNWLSFEADAAAPSRIRVSAATAEVEAIAAGTRISIGGTPASGYDGSFVVRSVGQDAQGAYIEVEEERFYDEAAAAGTLSVANGAQLTPAATGALTFDGTANTVTAATADAFAGIAVGSLFTVSGTGSNDGVFEVAANDGTSISIVAHKLPDSAGTAVTGTLASSSYYAGDTIGRVHAADTERTLDMSLNGADPAFEKALRAMALIAEGAPGTTGDLALHPDRIRTAIDLLNSAIDPTAAPVAGEQTGNLAAVQMDIGFQQVVVDEAMNRQQDLIASLETQIGSIENIDPYETITRLLDDSRALEASYQAVSRIRQLSLVNYL